MKRITFSVFVWLALLAAPLVATAKIQQLNSQIKAAQNTSTTPPAQNATTNITFHARNKTLTYKCQVNVLAGSASVQTPLFTNLTGSISGTIAAPAGNGGGITRVIATCSGTTGLDKRKEAVNGPGVAGGGCAPSAHVCDIEVQDATGGSIGITMRSH